MAELTAYEKALAAVTMLLIAGGILFLLSAIPGAAYELPSESLGKAPVSSVAVDEGKEVSLVMDVSKLDPLSNRAQFSSLKEAESFFDVRLFPKYGDAKLEVVRCSDYPTAGGKGSYYGCLPFSEKNLEFVTGETVKIRPLSFSMVVMPSGLLGASVWEELRVGGELIPGATWWNVSETRCQNLTYTNSTPLVAPYAAANISVPYDAQMQADFDDVRFVNAPCGENGTQIAYGLLNKADGVVANFAVNTTNAHVANSMYYGSAAMASEGNLLGLTTGITGGTAIATSAQGPAPASNAIDGVYASGTYTGNWIAADSAPLPINLSVSFPYNYTVIVPTYKQPYYYHIKTYRFFAGSPTPTLFLGYDTLPQGTGTGDQATQNATITYGSGSNFSFQINESYAGEDWQNVAWVAGAAEVWFQGYNVSAITGYSFSSAEIIPDVIPPSVNLSCPAVDAPGNWTFNVTASDNAGLSWTALYENGTFLTWDAAPVNATPSQFTVGLGPGSFVFSGWANDTAGNPAFSGSNCTIAVSSTTSTTTTVPFVLAPVTLVVPGLGWGILFFIIGTSAFVLYLASKR